MNRIVLHLLRRNLSVAQVITYFIALLCGITMIMAALQFHHDATLWLNPATSSPQEYVTLSKQVSRSGFTGNGFTADEIADLSEQPWVDSVAPYLPGDFSVILSVDLGVPVSTSMFLEALPDSFLDAVPQQWNYRNGSRTVPLIIPRDYLTLYNYGFATPRSMPVLSESTISLVPLTLTISGNSRSEQYRAKIVGFTSRANSVLAPENFIKKANRIFGKTADPEASRLIVKTSGNSAEMNSYLREKRLQRSGEGVDTSLLTSAVNLLTTLLITIGGIIIALSIVIQLLSLYLLVEKNRETNSRLILLGFSPAVIRRYYLIFTAIINLSAFAVASVLVPLISKTWQTVVPSSLFSAAPYLAGAAIVFLLTLPVIPMLRRAIR